MLRFTFTLISCFILFYSCLKSIDRPITDNEIAAVGTGFQVLYNLGVREKFAIMQPPLSGIVFYTSLKTLYQLKIIDIIPSGNYFDMISFIFAMETPKMIGNEVLSTIGEKNFRIIRYLNILWSLLIIYIISRRNILLGGMLALIFVPVTDMIMISTTQILSALLVVLVLELIISMMHCISYLKFILLGCVIGLLIAVSGTDGLLLSGMAIVSQIFWQDMNEKKLCKGFKKDWGIGSCITLCIAFFIAWICYGMDLACFCQLQSLLGFKPTNSIRIVPFFDFMKQTIFEVIFKINDNKYSFYQNISIFYNVYNGIITTVNLLLMIMKRNQYGIFSIILLISVFIYNNIYKKNIHLFFDVLSILMAIMIHFQVADYSDKSSKKL